MEKTQRNNSIDMFRYICAILVVAIHIHPFEDINAELGYIFTQIIPRIGVPFFFAIAGYYYIQNLEKGVPAFFKYIKRLLITYFLWSIIYYIIDFLMWGHANIKGFIINCIYSFIFTGSYYHFWFFPALIFSVVSTTLIFRIGLKKAIIPLSIVLYIIGCLGCSYYKLGIHIPILGNLYTNAHFTVIRRVILMAFPFFISGYTVFKIKNSVSKNSQTKKPIFFWIISFICWLAEIEIVRYFGLQANIVITFGLYLLVISTLLTLLNHPLPKYNKLSHQSRMLSNFTYYSHPLFITCLSAIFSNFFHIEISQTPLFVLTVLITCIFSLIICKFNNKYINLFVK